MAGFRLIPPRRPIIVAAAATAFGYANTGERPNSPPPQVLAPNSPSPPNASGAFHVGWNEPGLRAGKVTKGRLTNLRTRYFREFIFNPATISRTDAWDWGEQALPFASHKVRQGGAPGSRTISLALQLCADRGAKERRTAGINDDVGESSDEVKAVALDNDLNFYRAFTYPAQIRSDFSSPTSFGPDRVIFTYGSMFPSIEVIITSVEITVTQCTPDLRPWKAEVSISMEEVSGNVVSSTDIFAEPTDIINGGYFDTAVGTELE